MNQRVRWPMLFALIFVALAEGCSSADPEAVRVAVDFVTALRQADTATVSALSAPESREELLQTIASRDDDRLALDTVRPNARLNIKARGLIDVFIPSATDSLSGAGVYVVMKQGRPPQVLRLHMVPDVR